MVKYVNDISFLIVGGDKSNLFIIKEFLENTKFAKSNFTFCSTLKTAIKKLSASKFDFILLDLTSAGSEGLNTFSKIIQYADEASIIALLEPAKEELGKTLLLIGAEDYLIKNNFDSNVLSQTIDLALMRKMHIKEMKNRMESFNKIIENNSDGILVLGDDGKIKYMNPAAEGFLNLDADSVKCKKFDFLSDNNGITQLKI